MRIQHKTELQELLTGTYQQLANTVSASGMAQDADVWDEVSPNKQAFLLTYWTESARLAIRDLEMINKIIYE